ncbi:MAG: DNA translocase FtsK 4TM domain-containing protein, partial [Lachnospiraceae bacterium]|nr:DNA translocase FtsK 4TM domain-containing protein [Lachnospiraceae bacterium]
MATANNKKGASTKRTSSASTSKNNTISTEERQQVLKLSSEALQLLFLAFSVLLLLGNFSLTGGFGRVVNGFLFGLFGTMEYFFPILLFLGVSFYLANKGNARAMVRLAGIIILFFDLGIFFQLIFHNKYKSGVYSSLYGFGRDTHTGGGLICGGLYTGLSAVVGNVGTVIIFLALAIISIVLISGKSFIGGVKNSSKKVYANTVKAGNEYREKKRIRREERELERARERELMLERERELKSVDLNKGDMVLPHFDPAPEQAEPVAEVQLPGSNIAPGPVRTPEAVSTPQAISTPQTVISPETVVTPAAVITPEPVEVPVNTSSLQFTNIKRREAPAEKDIYADEVIDEGRLIDRDIRKKQKYDEEHRIVLSDTEYNPYRGAARIGEEERPAPVHAVNDILIETGFKQNEAEDEFISPEMAAASDLAIEVAEMMADERASEQEEPFSNESENRAAEEPVIIASNFEIVSEDEDVGADEHKIISFESRRRIAPSEDTEEDEEPEERPAVKPVIAGSEDAPEPVKEAQAPPKPVEYKFPPVELLNEGSKETVDSRVELAETAEKLKSTLASFGINVEVTNISRGPAVTRYEIKIEQGVKVSRILSLSDDLKLNLAATDIRIEAPIPGKAAIG